MKKAAPPMEVRPVVESFAHAGEESAGAFTGITMAKTVVFAAVEGVILWSGQKAAIK